MTTENLYLDEYRAWYKQNYPPPWTEVHRTEYYEKNFETDLPNNQYYQYWLQTVKNAPAEQTPSELDEKYTLMYKGLIDRYGWDAQKAYNFALGVQTGSISYDVANDTMDQLEKDYQAKEAQAYMETQNLLITPGTSLSFYPVEHIKNELMKANPELGEDWATRRAQEIHYGVKSGEIQKPSPAVGTFEEQRLKPLLAAGTITPDQYAQALAYSVAGGVPLQEGGTPDEQKMALAEGYLQSLPGMPASVGATPVQAGKKMPEWTGYREPPKEWAPLVKKVTTQKSAIQRRTAI